jgi:hypothetical protein
MKTGGAKKGKRKEKSKRKGLPVGKTLIERGGERKIATGR